MANYQLVAGLPASRPQRGFSLPLALAYLLMFVLLAGLMLPATNPVFAQINRGVGAALVLLYLAVFLPRQRRIAPELLLFGGFVLWGLVSGLIVANISGVLWSHVQTLFQAWAMACAVAGVVMARRNATVHWTILVAVGVMLIGYGYATGDFQLGQSARHQERASAVLHNPNALGIFMLYSTFGLACLWGARQWRFLRVLVPVLAVACALTIVASGSRKSLVCLVAFILLWLAFAYGRQLSRRFFVVVLVAGVALGGVYYLVDYAVQDRVMGQRLEKTLAGEGVAGMLGTTRTNMYVRGIRLFAHNPVTGVGLGQFAAEVGYGGYSHSDVIEVLSTTGFVGAMLYLPIYVILWRRLSRVSKWTRDPAVRYQVGVYKAAILTVLCLGLGAPVFLIVYHWFMLAALIGWSYGVERDLRAEQVMRLRARAAH